jgi:hypothetical protein
MATMSRKRRGHDYKGGEKTGSRRPMAVTARKRRGDTTKEGEKRLTAALACDMPLFSVSRGRRFNAIQRSRSPNCWPAHGGKMNTSWY